MATVLVVDDRKEVRDLLATVLQYGGHRVLNAIDGDEALCTALQERPDLVISDIVMPTMDGFEFTRRLRADPQMSTTPVIFYTATYLEREARALAEQYGVHHILTKPADPQLILDTVSTVLGLPRVVPQPAWDLPDIDPLSQLRRQIPHRAEELRVVGARLAGLLDLGLDLMQERDPRKLLEAYCREGRKIVGARYAGVASLDQTSHELRCVFIDGVEPQTQLQLPPITNGPLARVASDRIPRRLRIASEDWEAVAFPPGHPRLQSLLVVPVVSSDHLSGVMYFGDKVGGESFSQTDERVAAILALEFTLGSENARLIGELHDRAVQLEFEVQERRRGEEEIRKLNQQLTAKVELLSQSNADLEQFAYAASHDLKEPLRTINSYAQLLVRRFQGDPSPDLREFAGYIRQGTERMRALLEGLLAYSRVDLTPKATSCIDSQAVLNEALGTLQDVIAESHAIVSASSLPSITMNQTQLLQVFLNLLGNALKYRRPGVTPRVDISATYPDSNAQMVQFAIRDNGLGIQPEHCDKVFGLFRRLHGDEYAGVGLGLALCKRLVERNGGRIWVESQLGQGSTFYFTSPAAAQAASA